MCGEEMALVYATHNVLSIFMALLPYDFLRKSLQLNVPEGSVHVFATNPHLVVLNISSLHSILVYVCICSFVLWQTMTLRRR